ncbi:MAG: NAD-glutamate dehydrogenase, partial [Pseudomonadota bacterium]
MPETFHADEDEKTLERIIALAQKTQSDAIKINGGLPPDFEHYVAQMVRYATGEDRNWEEPETLLERAIEAWEASHVRTQGEHIVSLRAQASKGWRSERLVLDIITDDRPFLVDSISGALTEAGKPVSFFVNAVIDTERDASGVREAGGGHAMRESLIHAEMDPAIDASEVEALKESIDRVLEDVSLAVADWEPMRARLGACIAQLEMARATGVDRADQREAVDFLKWLWDNRFAFLGVRRYDYRKENGRIEFARDPSVDLGILKDPTRRVLKSTYSEHGDLSPAVEDFMQSGEPILLAKANAKSLVHRRAYMDYIGVKSYSVNGEVTGEDRFVGLFTAEAYNRPASDIPLLRSKVRKVVEHAGFVPGGHNEKALVNILETFPRDEMFQVDVETLAETARGILRLYKRPRVKLFMRRDRFDRFISALVFVPRDRFNSNVRESIGRHLAETFNGRVSAFYPSFGDATLVRVHFIIGIDPGAPEGPGLTQLTRDIRALCREWGDDLREALATGPDSQTPLPTFNRWENAFSASYREQMSVADA